MQVQVKVDTNRCILEKVGTSVKVGTNRYNLEKVGTQQKQAQIGTIQKKQAHGKSRHKQVQFREGRHMGKVGTSNGTRRKDK